LMSFAFKRKNLYEYEKLSVYDNHEVVTT
jgi:hypothetical protein